LAVLYQHRQERRTVEGSDARFDKAVRKCPAPVASVLPFVRCESAGGGVAPFCIRRKAGVRRLRAERAARLKRGS
jgi:hypothetical protein